MSDSPRVRVLASDGDRPLLPLVEGGGEARAIVWPGVGAQFRSLHRFVLDAGARTVVQRHPGEAVYNVIAGAVAVEDVAQGTTSELREGSMVHIEPGTSYRFTAGTSGAELIGGPSPADPALYVGIASDKPELKEA